MIKRLFRSAAPLLGVMALAGMAAAQTNYDPPPVIGWYACIDPANTTPFSTDFGVYYLNNELTGCELGVEGTVTYGGTNGPCFNPAVTNNVRGHLGLYAGTQGSIQSAFDDNVMYTAMAPATGNDFSINNLVVDGTQTSYGSVDWTVSFQGSSARYEYLESLYGTTHVFQRIDVLGDATRVAWQFQNDDTANTHTYGLWTGQAVWMITPNLETSGTVPFFANGKNGFAVIPGARPPLNERRFIRSKDPSSFPDWVNFDYGQTNAYGLRVENGPLDKKLFNISMTTYGNTPQQGLTADTQADEFVIGRSAFLLDVPTGNGGPMRDEIFPVDPISGYSDVPIGDDIAYIQKFYDTNHPVSPGASRLIIQYFRSTWGNSDYTGSYTVTVDAPHLLAFDSTNVANGQISPNPMTVRVNVDNTAALADIQNGVPLTGQVTLKFAKSTGLTFGPGQGAFEDVEVLNGVQTVVETCTKNFPNTGGQTTGIQPATVGAIDFTVVADGLQNGPLPYYATVTSVPPNAGGPKLITGTIYESTTPRLTIHQQANLVTVPWYFADSSWTNVLQLGPTDFSAFTWDPVQRGYVISTSAVRGAGAWLISNVDYGSKALNPAAQQPADIANGFGLTQLKSGWNLIGNPYNFPITLGQLVGVPGADPSSSFTYDQLVNKAVISSAVATWDSDTQSYQYVAGDTGVLDSNKGYWMYVFTAQDLTLKFPPVFQEFAPGIPENVRSVKQWNQDDTKWRLNLTVRNSRSVDDQNYVGVLGSTQDIMANMAIKPPLSPTQDVALSIAQTVNGQDLQMAQAYNLKAPQQQWKVTVQSVSGGPTTITWPNLPTIPTNTRFRLVDVATNVTRDMRQTSGYTFNADKNSTRTFLIQAVPGGPSRAIIGNVVVSRPDKSPGAAFTVTYTLSNDALTTVRILSNTGREVYTITQGRADRVGQNTVTWNLRDNANRAVAPGTYRLEILAETTNGDRVRKIVPVNVIR